MPKPDIVQAVVTRPAFINDVLHHPGDIANVDLAALGVSGLDAKNMTALKPLDEAAKPE